MRNYRKESCIKSVLIKYSFPYSHPLKELIWGNQTCIQVTLCVCVCTCMRWFNITLRSGWNLPVTGNREVRA